MRPASEQVRAVVTGYLREHGASTVSEVRQGTGFSDGAVRDHLARMVAIGVAERSGQPPRYALRELEP